MSKFDGIWVDKNTTKHDEDFVKISLIFTEKSFFTRQIRVSSSPIVPAITGDKSVTSSQIFFFGKLNYLNLYVVHALFIEKMSDPTFISLHDRALITWTSLAERWSGE